jgi:hypothetical protein
MGNKWENDWEWQLADSFTVSISTRKTRSNGPLFELVGATVPEKHCRRKPNRGWEAGHQECGEPRERSRDRDLGQLRPLAKCL